MIEMLRKDYEKTNQNIIQLEKLLEAIKAQKQLKNEKEMAISRKRNKALNISYKINNNIILISIILLGLIFGDNLANKYNKLFDNEDGTFENKGLQALKEESYIDHKTKNAIDLYEKILSQISL